jgi:hypothetical protein
MTDIIMSSILEPKREDAQCILECILIPERDRFKEA